MGGDFTGFHRAGLLRVVDLGEFFDAAETLGHRNKLRGKRLAILTNGGGIGVLAIDRLVDFAGGLAAIYQARSAARIGVAADVVKANPVDIVGDAGCRYAVALLDVLDDPANDAVLVMNVQTALASPTEAAKPVDAVRHSVAQGS